MAKTFMDDDGGSSDGGSSDGGILADGAVSFDEIDWSASSALPGWLVSVKRAVQEWGSFRLAVLGVVATALVNGALTAGEVLVEAVFLAFDPLINAIGLTQEALVTPLESIGTGIYGLLIDAQGGAAELAGASGPASPLIGSAIIALVLVAVYYGLKLVIGSIPVVDTINQFL